MLTSWPAQGSRRPVMEVSGFLIKLRSVSPCALALRSSDLRVANSCPWCCRTAWVLWTSLGNSVSWRRRENLRRAAPISAVLAEKLSTAWQIIRPFRLDQWEDNLLFQSSYHSCIDPFLMVVEKEAAQFRCQLTSIDPLVELIQAAANDHLKCHRCYKDQTIWSDVQPHWPMATGQDFQTGASPYFKFEVFTEEFIADFGNGFL